MSASGSQESEQTRRVGLVNLVQRAFMARVKPEPSSSSSSNGSDSGSRSKGRAPVEDSSERQRTVARGVSPDSEKCRVCAVGFEGRIRARCLGCVRRVHREGCSTYMTIANSYQVGMCNF